MAEEKLFPEVLTYFTSKRDAVYDGDPDGDYIVAEHVNSLQDAITRIEKVIGMRGEPGGSIFESLDILQTNKQLRVPRVGYFYNIPNTDTSYVTCILANYDIVIIRNHFSGEGGILGSLAGIGRQVFGEVDASLDLAVIQNQIANWKTLNVSGIYLSNFNVNATATREDNQKILDSIYQSNIEVIIHPGEYTDLFDNTIDDLKNPLGQAYAFSGNTYLAVSPFAYNDRYYTNAELMATTYNLIKQAKDSGLKIIGLSTASDDKSYQYAHTVALLFGISGLYAGNISGEQLETRTQLFDWPTIYADWETDAPVVFTETDGSLIRHLAQGSIRVNPDNSIDLIGYKTPSSMIDWLQNSIPGSAIAEKSIDPSKLSTYDIEAIVNLLNNADSSIKINLTKIKTDDSATELPLSIPAGNMTEHVIEAINRKNNVNTTNIRTIEDEAIESLSASKLTGNLSKAQMKGEVIQAVNEAANDSLTASTTGSPDIFLDVPLVKSDNIISTGTIQGNVVNGTNMTFHNASFVRVGEKSGNVTTDLLRINEYVKGHNGEFLSLYIQNLEVETLSGLKQLDLEKLTAEEIQALKANIAELEAEHAIFGTVIADNITTGLLNAELITAINLFADNQITNTALFGEAVIQSASIISLDAGKLTAGTIDTDLVRLSDTDGHLNIHANNIRIYDGTDAGGDRRLRTALGYVGDFITTASVNLETQKTNLATKQKELKVAEDIDKSAIEAEIASLQAAIAATEAEIANQPVGYEEDMYGLVVLGQDGTTRLFDNTGVYSAGIKDNVISNAKLQEDAVDDRVIRAGAITARSIQAETITGSLIAGKTIMASEKLIAKSIVGDLIDAKAISATHIDTGAITADAIAAGVISATHIKAGAIDTSKLTVSFGVNLMMEGYDSFEQESLGTFEGLLETDNLVTVVWPDATEEIVPWIHEGKWHLPVGSDRTLIPGQTITIKQTIDGVLQTVQATVYAYNETIPEQPVPGELSIELIDEYTLVLRGTARGSKTKATISDAWSYDGKKSLFIEGNQFENVVRLGSQYMEYPIPVFPGNTYFLSVETMSLDQVETNVRIGVKYKNNIIDWSPTSQVLASYRPTNIWMTTTVPEGVVRAAVVLSVDETNKGVYFDAIQLQIKELDQSEPGAFRPTSATKINGDNITTGRIDANHIHIGAGTVFGTDSDIIDITDEGIKARSLDGYAMLNSKGLEIVGGAFHLESNNINGQVVNIDGKNGIRVENSLNRIDIDAVIGLNIVNKVTEHILMDIDPTTGNLRFSGTAMFYPKDSPHMAWTIEDKFTTVDQSIEATNKIVEKSVKSIVDEFTTTSSPNEVPGVGAIWQPTPLPAENGVYIWQRSIVTLSDGTVEPVTPICITGSRGDNAYNILLSNDACVIPTDANGDNGDYKMATTTITITEGSFDKTSEWHIQPPVVTEGIIGALTGNTYAVTSMLIDAGEVKLTATKGENTLTKFFSISKSKQGLSAIAYEINLDTKVIIKDKSGILVPSTITAKGLAHTNDTGGSSYSGYFKIYERSSIALTVDEYAALQLNGSIMPEREYIISDTETPYVLRYTSPTPEMQKTYVPTSNQIVSVHIEMYSDMACTILVDNQTVMVASDGQDVYKVEVLSTNGNTFKNGIINTWLYAVVYKGKDDITSQLNNSQFKWTRISDDAVADTAWNEAHSGGDWKISISITDIYRRATFTCDILDLGTQI